jgi:Tfp pilus assembly protein PilF
MSKPMVVTLPFVLLLLDFWPFRRFEAADPSSVGTWERPAPNAWKSRGQLLWALVWEKFWLFACALVSSNITFQAQQHGGTVSDLDSTPLISRIANATVAYTGYLRKTFWPSNLAPFYPYSEFVQWLEVAFSVGILVGVTLLVLILGREFRYLPVGWFWYLGMLVPVIGLVQVGAQSMADRYTYIPLIGIFVIIAWGFSDLLSRARWRIQALSGSAAVAILLCAILTWQQVGYWKNGITLFSHTLAVTEGNWVAHHNLGWSLHDAGRYAEAREQFERTLELHPTLAVAHFNMGRVARDEGKLDEARSHYEDALGLDPMFELGHVEIGLLHARQGEVHEARAYFDSVLALWPEFEKVRLELARLLIEMGEFDAAAQHVQTIIETNPFQLDAREVLDRMRSQEISQ